MDAVLLRPFAGRFVRRCPQPLSCRTNRTRLTKSGRLLRLWTQTIPATRRRPCRTERCSVLRLTIDAESHMRLFIAGFAVASLLLGGVASAQDKDKSILKVAPGQERTSP